MALSSINPVIKKPDEGGGLLGSVAGGLAGLAAGALLAVPTGGASLAAAPAMLGGAAAGGSIGSQLGSMVGTAIDEGEPGGTTPMVSPADTDSRSKMTAMMKAPEVQLATMQNSKNLLATSDIPDAQNYVDQINQAQEKLKQQLGNNSFLGRG